MRAANDGDGLVYWFGAAPSTEYMVSVQDLFGDTSLAPYTLTATFTPANDPHKPNDSESLATPIVVGTPVQSLDFHGYTSTGGADIGWWSFYQVNLTSAPATVSVTNVPAGMELMAELYGNANEGYSTLGSGMSGHRARGGRSECLRARLDARDVRDHPVYPRRDAMKRGRHPLRVRQRGVAGALAFPFFFDVSGQSRSNRLFSKG